MDTFNNFISNKRCAIFIIQQPTNLHILLHFVISLHFYPMPLLDLTLTLHSLSHVTSFLWKPIFSICYSSILYTIFSIGRKSNCVSWTKQFISFALFFSIPYKYEKIANTQHLTNNTLMTIILELHQIMNSRWHFHSIVIGKLKRFSYFHWN